MNEVGWPAEEVSGVHWIGWGCSLLLISSSEYIKHLNFAVLGTGRKSKAFIYQVLNLAVEISPNVESS